MISARHDRAPSRPATTLVCSAQAILLWPGIPLTESRGGRIWPRGRETINGLVSRPHGPGTVQSGIVDAVARAAAHLNDGNRLLAERALTQAGLPPVTPDGQRLTRAVVDRFGLPVPDWPIGTTPRLWSSTDVDLFARLYAAQALAGWAELAKVGFNPDEPRDWHGRWTTGASTSLNTAATRAPTAHPPHLGSSHHDLTVIASTSAVLDNPVTLRAAIAAGTVVLESVTEAAAMITPVGWAVIGVVALGGIAYLAYQRVTAAPAPVPPTILPGREATPLPPIQPPGFPAAPPLTPPNHTGSPRETERPQTLTSPAEPMEEEQEGYDSLSPEELAILLPYWVNRGGESAAARFGRAVHDNYDPGPGFIKDGTIGNSRLRPDGFNEVGKWIKELKPDTPSGIALGRRQMDKYLRAAEKAFGGQFFGTLEFYNPVTGKITRSMSRTLR